MNTIESMHNRYLELHYILLQLFQIIIIQSLIVWYMASNKLHVGGRVWIRHLQIKLLSLEKLSKSKQISFRLLVRFWKAINMH
jgi:hypothetical protein